MQSGWLERALTSNASQASPRGGDWIHGTGILNMVSYVIPAYNAGCYLSEALESVANEDYRPLELVVVDDGSTDDTGARVERFKKNLEDVAFRIVYLQQSNRGVNAARNAGVRASSGEFIGFLDADDLFPRGRTKHIVKALRKLKADLVYGPCARFEKKSDVVSYLEQAAESSPVSLAPKTCRPFAKWIPNIWSFLATREFIGRVGPLSENVKTCCPDVDYSIKIRLHEPRMFETPVIVNLYRYNRGSMADRGTAGAIRDAMLSTSNIVELLQKHSVAEQESWDWVSRRFSEIGWWAVRIRLRHEAVDAFEQAAKLSRGKGFYVARSVAMMCRTTAGISMLAVALRIRSRAWVDVRNRIAGFKRWRGS